MEKPCSPLIRQCGIGAPSSPSCGRRALVHETVSRPMQVVWDDWTQRRDAFLKATEEP
jgi:hypothetical protein